MAKSRKKKSNRYILVIVLLAIVVGAVVALVRHNDDSKTKQNLAVSGTKTPATAATSTPQAPAVPTNQNLTPGGTVDKNGQTAGSAPPSSDWVSSASGDITLQQPSANSTVSNGDTISGTADVSTVNFTLTDNSVGLIDQGSLNVVNGKFSGLMEFHPRSTSGKLEVYYSNPSNGAEKDLIDIDVNFGS